MGELGADSKDSAKTGQTYPLDIGGMGGYSAPPGGYGGNPYGGATPALVRPLSGCLHMLFEGLIWLIGWTNTRQLRRTDAWSGFWEDTKSLCCELIFPVV